MTASRRLALLLLAVPLLVAGCGDTSEDAAPPATTVTESVTTTQQSDAEKKEEISRSLDSALGINEVTESNLAAECTLAIAEEKPEAGNLDFPEPIQMEPMSEGSEIYTANGDFRYEDAQDVWQDGFYHCQIITENGTITEASATAF